jgi:hypothetical protein
MMGVFILAKNFLPVLAESKSRARRRRFVWNLIGRNTIHHQKN